MWSGPHDSQRNPRGSQVPARLVQKHAHAAAASLPSLEQQRGKIVNPRLRGDEAAWPATSDCRCAGPCTPHCLASQFAMPSEHTEGAPRRACLPATDCARRGAARIRARGINPQSTPPGCGLTREQWRDGPANDAGLRRAQADDLRRQRRAVRQRRRFVRGSWEPPSVARYEVVASSSKTAVQRAQNRSSPASSSTGARRVGRPDDSTGARWRARGRRRQQRRDSADAALFAFGVTS